MAGSAFTFAFTPAALRSLRLDEDRLHGRGLARRVGPPRRPGPPPPPRRAEPLACRDPLVQSALFAGDLALVRRHFPESAAVNLVIEARGDELRWTSRKLGLWSLTYEQELTTPLHITAGRGYADCLRFLLLRGAAVDFAPSGKTALHEACAAAHAGCARLLLSFGADPQAVSEDGFQPLHLCKSPGSLECARLLLQSGASVNVATEDEEDSPLHVAARHGLPEHVGLLLRYGAAVDAGNEEGQTPLHAACSQPHEPEDIERYFEVCQQLVEHGARVDVPDRDLQRPLHLACKVANPRVVELLLSHGASVNIMNYSGNTAMHNVLQVAAYKLLHQPERIVRALLNHGAVRVWPGSLTKVLRYCHAAPRVIEALINSYDRVRVPDEWAEAVPRETQQKHRGFYRSLLALGRRPRSLQHLARCALRARLEGRVPLAAPRLGLPPALLRFLLLDFEDVLY